MAVSGLRVIHEWLHFYRAQGRSPNDLSKRKARRGIARKLACLCHATPLFRELIRGVQLCDESQADTAPFSMGGMSSVGKPCSVLLYHRFLY